MAKVFATMILWGVITKASFDYGFVSYEYAYIGLSIMLAAGLLHKEE